jgi:hypothetical protein
MKKIEERKFQRNGEGYSDPTAYQALKNVENDPSYKRFHALLEIIFRVCTLAGFHLEERIVVKDLRTGKIWR